MADVLFEQVQGDGVERLGDRGNLGEDVDAVLVFVYHAGDAADLPFDAAQSLEVRLFVGGVTVLGFGCLAAAACAGVRLAGFFSGFLGWRAGCGADLGGCAVAALVAGGFHGLSVYPRGVYRKGVLRVVTRCGFSYRGFLRREATCLSKSHHYCGFSKHMWLFDMKELYLPAEIGP